MSRLTGSDAKGLMEAYQAVYAPKQLTEEQVWEEVENWVNSLLEEGYDLSNYTWEEMYENYLKELSQTGAPEASAVTAKPSVTPTKPAKPAGPATGMLGNTSFERRTPTSAEFRAAQQQRFAQKVEQERSRVPIPDGEEKILQAAKLGGQQATADAIVNKGAVAALRPTNPQALTSSEVRNKFAAASAETATSAPTTPTPTSAAPKPSLQDKIRQQRLNMSFDPFDVVLGHLLDEGYADTQEAALAIMSNMSEEWRNSIVENAPLRDEPLWNMAGDKTKPPVIKKPQPQPPVKKEPPMRDEPLF